MVHVFTGTLWFNTYKGEAASYFINKENYDAIVSYMCLILASHQKPRSYRVESHLLLQAGEALIGNP